MNRKYIVRQQDIKDCGICCLESIIKYYGGFIPLETLRLDTRTGNNGTTAFNLIKAAKKYGFHAMGRKDVDLDSKDLILPAVAHVVTKRGLNHFVVIYKIMGDTLLIMDPARGYVKVKREIFLSEWTNIILIFKPYKKIPLIKMSYDIKSLCMQVLASEKKMIFKIVGNQVLITVLSVVIGYYFKIVLSSVEKDYFKTTIFVMVLFLLLHIMKIYFNYVKNELTIYLNKNIDLLVIPEFVGHIFKLPLNIICSRTSGEILTRVRDLSNIKDLFTEIFVVIIMDLFLVVCSMFFLYYISDALFFILLVIALLYVVVGLVSAPILFKKLNNNMDLETEFNAMLSEKVRSLETIKNVGMTNKEIDSLESCYTMYQEDTFCYSLFMNTLLTIKSIINDLGLFAISSYGVYLIMRGDLTLLSLITFNTLLSYFIEPIENSIDVLPKLQLVKLSFNKISEFLNIDKENLGKVESFSVGDIEFRNVKFSYNDYDNVLDGMSLVIPCGTHNLIKGPTGRGKSTMCKMLNRGIDDYKGVITIDGINIKDYSLNTIRKNVLYVSQRESIFNDSIQNNITLGKNITKHELNEVLKITKVDEIINKKDLRLESMLYDEGFNLSGGERQRIILARSLLLNPQVLILDESLSEVDKETETDILECIDKKYQGITILYISHTNTKVFSNVIEMR